MPKSLQQTDADTDCADFVACATGTISSTTLTSELIDGGTAGSAEQSTDIPADSSRLVTFMQSSGGIGEQTWDGGQYSVPFNITTSQMNTAITGVWICRIDSSCTSQATVGSDTAVNRDISGGGVFTFNISGSQQSAAATDDLYIIAEITNTNTHTARTVGITPDQVVDTPITETAKPSATVAAVAGVSLSKVSTDAVWSSAADWDNAQSESGFRHFDDAAVDAAGSATLEKGYSASDEGGAALEGYWALDEDSGTAANDASGNGRDGTISGATTGQTGTLGTTSYAFGGGEVDLPAFGLPADYSVSAWIKFDSVPAGDATIYQQRDTDNNNNNPQIDYNDGVELRFLDQRHGYGVSWTWTPNTGQWYHVVCIGDSGDGVGHIYVDGTLRSSSSGGTNAFNGVDAGTIGSFADGTLDFPGDIDEVRVYSRDVGASGVQSLLDAVTGTSDYWTSKKQAIGNSGTITLTTTTTIPANMSVSVTLFEDVEADGTGANTDGLGNSYDNSASTTLSGGASETNDLTGFDGGGSTNDYWARIQATNDNGDATNAAPTISSTDLDASVGAQTASAATASAAGSATTATATPGATTASGAAGSTTASAPAATASPGALTAAAATGSVAPTALDPAVAATIATTPALAAALASAPDPTASPSTVTATPAAGSVASSATTPTAASALTAAAALAAVASSAPTASVAPGATTASAAAGTTAASALDPALTATRSVTAAVASAVASAPDATASAGVVTATGATGTATSSATPATATPGATSATPAVGSVSGSATTPTATTTTVGQSASAATATTVASALDPTVSPGVATVTQAVGSTTTSALDPTTTASVSAAATAATATALARSPSVTPGGVAIAPTAAIVSSDALTVTVTGGVTVTAPVTVTVTWDDSATYTLPWDDSQAWTVSWDDSATRTLAWDDSATQTPTWDDSATIQLTMADNTITQQTQPAAGENIDRTIQIDEDGSDKDISGATVEWYLLPDANSDAADAVIDHDTTGVSVSVSDGAAGEVTLTVEQGVTDALGGNYWQRLVVDDTGTGLQKWGGSFYIDEV